MSLSSREKVLAGIVIGAAFLVLNLVLGKSFFTHQAELRSEIATRDGELKTMQSLLAERDLWTKREAWLTAKQPHLTDENSAGVDLLQQIEKSAKAQNVTLENKSFGSTSRTQWYRAVSVNLETKCAWTALIPFLNVIQQPDQFIVLENVDIAVDSTDQTQMRGKFRIARWFAP